MPAELRPDAPEPPTEGRVVWTLDLLTHWREVLLDLAEVFGVDLHDERERDRSWLGIRAMVVDLITRPGGRLSQALAREVMTDGGHEGR